MAIMQWVCRTQLFTP